LAQYVGNFRTMNQIYRLFKRGCYAFRLLVCKQLHGNGLPLTTTSAIIDLKIIALLRKVVQHGGCANSHGLRVRHASSVFSRAWSVPPKAGGQNNNMRRKKGVVAPHSADTETNRRLQLPFLPVQTQIYVIIFSTSTRVMEINYFRNTFICWFLKGDFRI